MHSLPSTRPRLVGIVLMVVGVALVTLFPGAPVDKPLPGRAPVGRTLTQMFAARPGGGNDGGGAPGGSRMGSLIALLPVRAPSAAQERWGG
jgi:hypothetical protein